jgi:hypothetical protein
LEPVKRTLLTAAAVLAVAAPGCGQSEKDKVKSTVQSYVDGLASSDGKKVCDQLTTTAQDQIKARAQTKDCASAIERFEKSKSGRAVAPSFKNAKVSQVNQKGSSATAQVEIEVAAQRTSTTVPLEKQDGDWRITGATAG